LLVADLKISTVPVSGKKIFANTEAYLRPKMGLFYMLSLALTGKAKAAP